MTRLVTLCAFLLATSCSHSDTKSAPVPTPAAAAPSAKSPKAKSVKSASTDGASCKHGEDVRNLEIVAKGEGCAVKYTKHGETKELASAEHETKHCKDVVGKVRGHLEASGFSCD